MKSTINVPGWRGISALLATGILVLGGCASDGPFEEAGEEVDEAADEVEDAFDD
jgi:hypothetical protein